MEALQQGKKQRVVLFDYIKGLVMVLIVWGHVTNALFAGEVTYYFPLKLVTATFAMPMYMWISGIFSFHSLERDGLGAYCRKRLMRILVPCILWNILNWVIVSSAKIVLGRGNISWPNFFGNWFFWALFICNCLFAIQVKLFNNLKFIIVSSILISIVLVLIPSDRWFLAWVYPFFALGYLTEGEVLKEYNLKNIWCISIAFYLLLLPFYKDSYLVYSYGSSIWNGNRISSQMLVDMFRFLIGVFGVCMFTGIMQSILKTLKGGYWGVKKFVWIGKNSLEIYVLQALFVETLMQMVVRNVDPLREFLQADYDVTVYLIGVPCTIIFIELCLIIERIMKKSRWIGRYLFGSNESC